MVKNLWKFLNLERHQDLVRNDPSEQILDAVSDTVDLHVNVDLDVARQRRRRRRRRR